MTRQFKFNQEKVLSILDIVPNDEGQSSIRVTLTYNQLKALVLLDYVDDLFPHNDAPNIREVLEFCEENDLGEEEILMGGYLIVNRRDKRLSIDTLMLMTELASKRTIKNFKKLSHLADEVEEDYDNGIFRLWWD